MDICLPHRFMKRLFLALILLVPAAAQAQTAAGQVAVEVPAVVLEGVPFSVVVRADSVLQGNLRLDVQGREYPLSFINDGRAVVEDLEASAGPVSVAVKQNGISIQKTTTRALAGWLSLLPPLLAIGMALLFRQVIAALFVGIWSGAWLAHALTWKGAWIGLLETVQVYVLEAMANPDHVAIIIFSLMIGGMVGVISRGGGMMGVVNKVVGFANDPRSGQLVTSLMGTSVFFDDYANTLVVGNTMRPLTDRLQISREKLAYLVDSTAAPIASLALVTTWIGYEVGLIGTAVEQIDGLEEGAYSIFLHSLPYSFYPLLALFFVYLIAWSGRDFGPMYEAERRARTTGQTRSDAGTAQKTPGQGDLAPKKGRPQRAINAVLPIVTLIGSVLAGLYVTGEGETLREVVGSANAYNALLWGSLLGVMVSVLLVVVQGILSLTEALDAWLEGIKTMLLAMVILVLAWALSGITEVLHTADYLVSALGPSIIPGFLPAIIAVLAAFTAFATGSSWGTMGILTPLVVPLTWAIMQMHGMSGDPESYYLLYSTVAVVLGGAVWGDHCSPISDTTILSSMASGCDHIEHVRTQLPYALVVGMVSLGLGTLPAGFGWPWWVCLPLSMGVLLAIVLTLGKPVPKASQQQSKPTGSVQSSSVTQSS